MSADTPWAEAPRSRRRALADALAALRELPPLPPETPRRLSPVTARRLASALPVEGGGPLSELPAEDWRRLDEALAVYLDWVAAEPADTMPPTTPAAVLTLRTRHQAPHDLHRSLVETICRLAGEPVQDM